MKLLIADDHPIFRKGLMDILQQSFPGARLIEAETGNTALEKIKTEVPDVSILDIDMPEMNGLEICKYVYTHNINTKVVILTMYKEEEIYNKAFLTGASGYVIKDNSVTEIVDCIKTVSEGKKYVGPSLQEYFARYLEADKKKSNVSEQLKSLTQAELKTLKLVNQSRSSKEIAELLFVSVKTVENYRSRICKKLNLDSRNNSLLLWVMENKDVLSSMREF